MAYEKQTWVTGEVITKEKLNHMEDGIVNSGGVIASNFGEDYTLDKTWNEINTALRNGQLVILNGTDGDTALCGPVVETTIDGDSSGSIYVVVMITVTSDQTVIPVAFTTSDPDGYPSNGGHQ